jgi:hypothetical protein
MITEYLREAPKPYSDVMAKFPYLRYADGKEVVNHSTWVEVVSFLCFVLHKIGFTEKVSISYSGLGVITHMWAHQHRDAKAKEVAQSMCMLILSFLIPFEMGVKMQDVRANFKKIWDRREDPFTYFPFETLFTMKDTVVWN